MSIANLTHLDPAQYRRTPWKNGGGVTIDIADAYKPGSTVGDWDGMLWRFGRTRIEQPGPFSDLSGLERIIAVIEGRGLVLHPQGRALLDLRAPFKPVRFAGEWKIASELTQGPVGVLNLLADRTRFDIDMEFLAAAARRTIGPGHVIVWAQAAARLGIEGGAHEMAQDASLSFDAIGPVEIIVASGHVAAAILRNK